MNLELDGSQMTHADWSVMYPPHVPECKQLPGTQLPYWHYEWSFCTSCKNVLNLCKHNPFGVSGEITKARRAKLTEKALELAPVAAEPVKAIPVPKSITKRLEPSTVVGIAYPKGAKGDYVKGRRGRIKRTVDVTPELVQHTLKMIREGSGMVAIAKEFNVNPAELSVALKEAGLVLQRGRPRKE